MQDTPQPRPGAGDLLLIVDLQNDFLPGGALAVPRGDEVIPVLNRYIDRFSGLGLPVVATRDWHPADHCSFLSRGGIWPAHCVAGSAGAASSATLPLPESALIVSKGTGADQEAYSGFAGTELERHLRDRKLRSLFVGGLATDYCVLNTVIDALKLGFGVVLLRDAIRAVDVRPGDGERAIREMLDQGAAPADFESLQAQSA